MRGGAIRGAAIALVCIPLVAASSLAGATTEEVGSIRLAALGDLGTSWEPPSNRPIPATLKLRGVLKDAEGAFLPKLSRIELRLSPRVRIDPSALPRCSLGRLQRISPTDAAEACGDARVGSGSLVWRVKFPADAAFVALERLYAFNGRYRGSPAILVVGGSERWNHRYLIPFVLRRAPGSPAQRLRAVVPPEANTANGAITSFELILSPRHRTAGAHPYVTASCPVPPGRSFLLGSLAFGLETGIVVSSPLSARCGNPSVFGESG